MKTITGTSLLSVALLAAVFAGVGAKADERACPKCKKPNYSDAREARDEERMREAIERQDAREERNRERREREQEERQSAHHGRYQSSNDVSPYVEGADVLKNVPPAQTQDVKPLEIEKATSAAAV